VAAGHQFTKGGCDKESSAVTRRRSVVADMRNGGLLGLRGARRRPSARGDRTRRRSGGVPAFGGLPRLVSVHRLRLSRTLGAHRGRTAADGGRLFSGTRCTGLLQGHLRTCIAICYHEVRLQTDLECHMCGF